MIKEEFLKQGFSVVEGSAETNELLELIQRKYPSILKDGEINLEELKRVLGLPVDEKVNGYGLNFVGRNFARAKYTQRTEKELKLNPELSKNIDTTQNLVLIGDNLDCLKILKNYYTGKIKCIYIDPPYNTSSDEFIYPDKFDKEEAEVLGLQSLSEEDFARMEFAFKTKKSHSGWLSFMYPRLLLARDLLSQDGVIFISIDDNEQANLKLLCDEVFGEENFVCTFVWTTKKGAQGMLTKNLVVTNHESMIAYAKDSESFRFLGLEREEKDFQNPDADPRGPWKRQYLQRLGQGLPKRKLTDPQTKMTYEFETPYTEEKLKQWLEEGKILFPKNGKGYPARKEFLSEYKEKKQLVTYLDLFPTKASTEKLYEIFDGVKIFTNPKPLELIKQLIKFTMDSGIVLDFFAGSGTTGQAVMQLNAEDASTGSAPGNRKFILCQIAEPIQEDKPAYKFCKENKLPPVISSITVERLRRAGEKIKAEYSRTTSNQSADVKKNSGTESNRSAQLDIGFKVFDLVDAPRLTLGDNEQIHFPKISTDPLSRIYNMIFTVGLDEPTIVPEEVVKDSVYKIGNHYYITNSEKVTQTDFQKIVKQAHSNSGKIFVDGWTASLNSTLEYHRENLQIVF
ncbi:MAG: site-specific DNA-methyltransferase [Leptospiraceae bacterium]|nr:site-specific DNA-methyltransferase [Leptospiraceae bacterium]